MKRKQSKQKKGKSTSRKGKGFLEQFIEKYGEKEGIKKFNEFVEKQKISHEGKTWTEKQYKIMKNKEPWNKGKTYKLGPYSEERKQNLRKGQLKSFYKKLDKNKVELIRELNNKVSISEISKQTGYHFNKVKRIIKEIL